MMRPVLWAGIAAISLTTPFSTLANSIRYVDYHPDRIPNIITAEGIASEIIFEEDEDIVYHTFGFDAAWEAIVVRDHILIFKSKDPQPETNLLVHTNKRHYVFTLSSGNNDWSGNPNHSNANYSVRVRYHDGKTKEKKEAEERSQELRHREITSSTSPTVYTNYDYRATSGASNLIPSRMWDNGVLTFMSFRSGTKRGVAYELQSNGKTALVNQHTEKNGVLVVHGVYPNLILRLGDEAVELRRNDLFGQRDNPVKTNVPAVRRTEKSSAPGKWQTDGKRVDLEQAPIFKGEAKPSASEEEPLFPVMMP